MAYKNDEEKHELNEPQAGYGALRGKPVRVYHSFEEAGEAEAQYEANRSPIERLRETVQLILRTYGFTQETLSQRKRSTKLTIIHRE